MMAPPVEVLLAVAGWLVVFVLAVGLGGRSLSRSRREQRTLPTCAWLLVMTAMLPIGGLVTIPFDEFARDQWFPAGTPGWFVAYEIYFWVAVWVVLAGVILFVRRPLRDHDWVCAVVLGAVVTAGAMVLSRGLGSAG